MDDIKIISQTNLMIGAAACILFAAGMQLTTKKKRLWNKKRLDRRKSRRRVLSALDTKLRFKDPMSFANFTLMPPHVFQHLLSIVEKDITKVNTRREEALSAEKRLAITLRYLTTGETFNSLMYYTEIGEVTIGEIVEEVCYVIYARLQGQYLKVPNTIKEWSEVADGFKNHWGFPNCLGAIDGKYIRITPPANSGSCYFNYKSYHSVVLLTLVDCRCRILYFDCDINGRVSDDGVFRESSLNRVIQRNSLNFPPHSALPGVVGNVPYVFVANNPFPLTPRIMKAYPHTQLDKDKEYFNYRLSQTRKVVERACGILTNKFRIFLSTMPVDIKKVDIIFRSTLALHNFLLTTQSKNYYSADSTYELSELTSISQQCGNRSSWAALEIRNKFKKYFTHARSS